MAEMKARLVFKDVDAQQEVGRISFEDDWTFLDVSDPDSETFCQHLGIQRRCCRNPFRQGFTGGPGVSQFLR